MPAAISRFEVRGAAAGAGVLPAQGITSSVGLPGSGHERSYVQAIRVSLRTGFAIPPGQILVQAVIIRQDQDGNAGGVDLAFTQPALWRGSAYVTPGNGIQWVPNATILPGEKWFLNVQITNKPSTINSTTQVVCDVAVEMGDFPSPAQAIVSYPAGMYKPGMGFYRSFSIANPAVGADFSQSTPTGIVWRVISVAGTLATSAVAGARRPTIFSTESDDTLLTAPYGTATGSPANTTDIYGWSIASTQAVGGGTFINGAMADRMMLRNGQKLKSKTYNKDGLGDQWSLIVITVEEWVESLAGATS